MAPLMLPMPPSTAAVKALRPAEIAHHEVDLGVVEADQHAGGAAERRAQEESGGDHLADIDAHDRRHLAVLGHGADRAAERGALDQRVERPHQKRRRWRP